MYRIFKYELDDLQRAVLPEKNKIIRVDSVDDEQYQGDFVWAIVDENDRPVKKIKFSNSDLFDDRNHESDFNNLGRVMLGMYESQKVEISGEPVVIRNEDGHMFLYFEKNNNLKNTYKINSYLTGQKMTGLSESFVYLGTFRFKVQLELCLYVFSQKI